jgi:hypothetical protein
MFARSMYHYKSAHKIQHKIRLQSQYKFFSIATASQNQEFSYFQNLIDPAKYREKPQQIWVKNKRGISQKMNIEEVEKIHHFRWKEDVFFSAEISPYLGIKLDWWKSLTRDDFATSLYKTKLMQVKYYLEHVEMHNKKFALVDMDDLGVGAAANEDIIGQADDVITFYAGEALPEQILSNIYGYQIYVDGKSSRVDAVNSGNISRFFSHLPHPREIDPATLPGINVNEVATQNVSCHSLKIGKCTFPVFNKRDDIPAGHLIGFSYGANYWKNRSFWLLKKTGEKIAEVEYTDNQTVKLKV